LSGECAQRDDVGLAVLRPLGRDGPGAAFQIDVGPTRSADCVSLFERLAFA